MNYSLRCLVIGICACFAIHFETWRIYYFALNKKEKRRRRKECTFIKFITMSQYRDIVPTDMYVWYYTEFILTVVVAALQLPAFGFAVETQETMLSHFARLSIIPIVIYWILYGDLGGHSFTKPRWMRK